MQIIWENLAATILLLGITLTLVIVNERNQRTLTESTAFYSLKTQGIAFADVLKRDLQGVDEVFTHAEVDSVFRFNTRIGTDTTLREITYRRRWVRRRGEVDFYQIERFMDGTPAGGSMGAVTAWEIQALSEENDTLTVGDDLENCRKIHVRFEAASPFVDTETVDRMRWETTFVPPMRRRSTVLYPADSASP